VSKYWHRARRLIAHNILHADDTPHSIAMGASIAMFIAILPLIGVQMILSVAVAALLRVNKAVCVPVVWISNPLTALPLYGACFAVGRAVMNSTSPETVVLTELAEPVKAVSWLELSFWTNLFSHLVSLGVELWVGSAIIGLGLAILTYPLTRWLIGFYRERRRRHLLQKQVYKVLPAAPARRTEVA